MKVLADCIGTSSSPVRNVRGEVTVTVELSADWLYLGMNSILHLFSLTKSKEVLSPPPPAPTIGRSLSLKMYSPPRCVEAVASIPDRIPALTVPLKVCISEIFLVVRRRVVFLRRTTADGERLFVERGLDLTREGICMR